MDRHSLPSWLPNRPEASHRRCGNLDDFRANSGPTQPFGDALFMPLDLIDDDNALVRSSSNETPSVGSHSVEPRPPHLTSLDVKGLPSCHLMPRRNGKVSSVPSSLHDQPVARSGTIDCRLFCGTSCLYIIRLLKTPVIGRLAAAVASSCNDMLAGLSKWDIFNTPPCFWANAT